jgi:uncharacterized protein YjiS (DUF1127 family)
VFVPSSVQFSKIVLICHWQLYLNRHENRFFIHWNIRDADRQTRLNPPKAVGFCLDPAGRAARDRLGLHLRQTVAGRRALARMDERMFADIGISQSEAAFEMNRKPWDTAPLPSNLCL